MIAIIEGAEIVWPDPIGRGTSWYAAARSSGRTNASRGRRTAAFPGGPGRGGGAGHSGGERGGTTAAKRSRAGPLLIGSDRGAERPTSHTSPPERPPRADVKPS